MEPYTGDEGGRIECEIEHLEGDGPEAANVDDEEVEELHNSLKEAVQDPSVKPRLQCLMVDPSFSMVTVQSEDSGIVWETASSRCSTPWASEASSPSDAYSMEGSGTQGNIVIIMDEDKIRRKRTSSKGKLGDRFRRRLSGAAIGEERPAMTEVSVPNVRSENSEDGQGAENLPDKDQELFNLISEGFEILNIVVPKLPTVDEEDTAEPSDNLSYLEDTPKIKSKCRQIEITGPEDVVVDIQETKDENQKDSADEQAKKTETDLDYLEKFTLLDENAPANVLEKTESVQAVQSEEPQVPQEKEKVDDKLDEDSFVIISDIEIPDDHLDEVFYGATSHEETRRPSYPKGDGERESSKTLKECGSTLFGSQECILIPVYLPSGPPKIIDQDLLDEPRAMSFHYSDLYEDALGDRKKDDDVSDVESVISEKSFKRRYSDSDDADGYLEKFTLKDDTQAVKDVPEADHSVSGRVIWPQSRFEMTGCLIAVEREKEPQEEDASVCQSKVEGTQDAIKGQVQTQESSEGCVEVKTECVLAKSVSESLEGRDTKDDSGTKHHTGCDTSEGCGTETGCVIAKIISHDHISQKEELSQKDKEKDKPQLLGDGKQSKVKLKQIKSSHIPGIVQVKETKMKDELEVLPVPQKHEKKEVTGSVTNETAFQGGLENNYKVTDSTVEIEETIIITKKEVLNKGQHHGSKTQEKAEPDLVVEAAVKDTFVAKTPAEKVQILPQDVVHQKELPASVKESMVIDCKPEKSEEVETKPSTEKIPEPECVKATEPLLVVTSEILENSQVPAVVEEEARVESVMQEQVTDRALVLEVAGHVMAKSEAKDIENKLETISEQKAMEKLQASGTDAIEKKTEEVKVKVTEKTKEENEIVEDLKDTVPAVGSELPARDIVTTEKKEVIDSTSAVEGLTDVPQNAVTPEKHVLVEEPKKLGKDVSLKHEVPREDHDKIIEKRSEEREVEGNTFSADTLTQEIPVALPTITEVSERDLLPTVVLPPVIDKEKHELAKDTHAESKREPTETVSLIPTAKTEDSSQLSVPNEVVQKEEDREIKDVVKDLTLEESTEQILVPDPVQPAAGVNEDASETPTQEVESKTESKSKKVLLKDTHKENIWRTLEPTTPPPPVERQNSPARSVSPLELPEYITKDNKDLFVDGKFKRDTGLFSTLRSFSPHEDLSGFGRDTAEQDLNRGTFEELDYEMVTEQDARQPESEVIVDKKEHQELCFVQDKPAEQTIEASYEFIEDLDDAQTSELGHLIKEDEILPMDAFCVVCRCPLLMSDGGHQNHEVSSLDKAFDDIRNELSNWISVLQERSENIEDMVSELEMAYNSVEELCKDSEKAMNEQNEEVLKLVMDQYNEMSQTMEDEKKVKLEQLYDQIVSFQANTDSAKEAMEAITKEMEETDDLAFVSSYKDIDARLKTALESTMSLELGPRSLLVFEDYAKGTTGNEKKNRQVIPVPQQPHLQPQEANSATSTSVTVYWTINEGDIIDCFQVYCMEDPQGAISEEYRVTVKESYCSLEELEPDKCYKVWVMAVNYTGCSLPSERLPFRTAPSVPVIHPEACTVLWDSATIRWSSAQPSAADSYTLEYCRQYAMEGEGLRSVSGIKGYEHKVLLQPNENFLFYIKSVNAAGASEQSEAALVSTRGTRFHLLTETANPVLKVSEDRNSVEYPLETYNEMFSIIDCPAVMGENFPRVGFHYWETVVAGCKAYRIGVAYQTAPQDSTVGDNSASWCLHCVPTSISCRFELLHDNVESDIFVMDVPARIGTLLDFSQGRLVFFNAHNGQCLGSFQQSFTQPCRPVFVLENAGRLELKMTTEVPEFAKHW